ncbi:MAG: M14 family metallopeptidase [Bacteroidota bacterium]|nr:M14 family metallopeptidase [Bacteroidota bacterium]
MINKIKMIEKIVIIIGFICILSSIGYSKADKELTKSSLKALGAPNNPKVEVVWNRYYDHKEVGDICERISKAYPKLAKFSSIGKSYEGRDLWLLTVSNSDKGSPDKKPAMYIDGNIHGNEIQGGEVSLYTAWYLTEMYGHIDWITELLDQKTFYVVPTINPDGRDAFIHKPNNANSPRSGFDPRDDDGDGLIDEDGPDDLDGDGEITQMRVKDVNGRWVTDPDDPRIMRRAKPDEQGKYELLWSEGIDNDEDGMINEDGPGYYDPNRNWPWKWAPQYVQWGADQYPVSLPETRAVVDFVLKHDNIAAFQTYHNSGGMILRGPGNKDDVSTYRWEDLQVYDFLGKLGEEMLPGYKYLVVHKDLYPVYGGELDWFYAGRGAITFSNELWTSFDYFRKKPEAESDWFRSQKDTYRFDKLLLFGEGIVDWKPFNHPQYGKIEIGGIKKAWTRTAPSFLIEEMCHRNMAFTLYHAYHTPQVSVDSIYTKELPNGLMEVSAVIKNSRVIPTHTTQDLLNKITRPDWISITGGKILTGAILEDRFTGLANEQKRNPGRLEISNIPGMGAVYVRWIVEGKGPFTVTVDASKGGTHSKTSK